MLPSIANLVAAESHNNYTSGSFYSSADDVSSSSSSPCSPLRHYLLHEGFVWESPSATSSSPSSPSSSCSDYASTPSSPTFTTTFTTATSTNKSRKASLSFILNDSDSDDDLAASSFESLLPPPTQQRTNTNTNNKRKRSSSGSDQRAAPPSKEPRTMTPSMVTGQLTDDQRATLEAMFELDPLPGTCAKVQLADQLGVPLKSVQLWFQNHRSKLRKREKKRLARAEAARRAAASKPRFIFHNMKAKAQANGFLQQFVVDTH